MVEGGSTITQQTVKLLIRPAAHRRRQAARDAAGAAAGASARQARDPGPLPERGAVRQPAHRRRSGEPRRTSDVAAGEPHARAGRVPGRPAAAALGARPVPPSRRVRSPGSAGARRAWSSAASSPRAERPARARRAPELRPAASRAFTAPHFVERALRAAGEPAPRGASRPRSTPSCRREVAGILAMHRAPPRGARRAPRRGGRPRQRAPASGWPGKGSGDYVDDATRRAHRRRGRAAPAGLRAEALHLRASPSSAASRRPPCCPTCPRTSRPPSRACSTARATTTACSAARCARAWPWPAPRTCPRSGRCRGSASPTCCGCCAAAGLSTLDQTADHYGYALTMGDAEVRLDELVAAYSALARGGVVAPAAARARGSCATAASRSRRRPRRRAAGVRARRVLGDRHPVRSRRARVGVRRGEQPRLPVPGGGEDGHVAGVSRQLDGGLHARGDGRGVGRQLRPRAAAQLVRRHRRGAHLPRRAAGRGAQGQRAAARGHRSAAGRPGPGLARRTICALSGREATRSARAWRRNGFPPEHLPPAPGTGTTGGGRWWTGRRPIARGRGRAGWSIGPRSAGHRMRSAGAQGRRGDIARGPPLRIVNPPAGRPLPARSHAAGALPDPALARGRRRLRADADLEGGRPPGGQQRPRRRRSTGRSAIGAHTIAVTDDRGRTHETSILVK